VVTIDAFAFPVDSTNAEQASDWDGADGAYWATYHREYERLLGVFDSILLDATDVRAGDVCLDVGCGTGATTRALAARAVDGRAVGLDLSGPMLTIAREAAGRAGLGNVDFVQADAQVHAFEPASFDVAVSRMGCMFFGDPAAAFTNVGRALRPGGRLAVTIWRAATANGWITAIDDAFGDPTREDESTEYEPGPFSLADPDLVRSLLRRAGFMDIAVEALDVPLPFGSVNDAQVFLETWMDDDLEDDVRARTTAALHDLLVENTTSAGVLLPSATWLVTARVGGTAASAR
jgi:SAM-dependent methyltransferase